MFSLEYFVFLIYNVIMIKNLKAKLNTFFDKSAMTEFFYGPFYPVFVALFITLAFASNASLAGLLLVSLTASVVFLRFEDATPIIPLLFFVVLCFRDYNVMNGVLGYIFLAPALISFIARFFLYPIKKFRLGKLFLPLVGVSVALLLNGLLSDVNNYTNGLVTAFTIGPVMIIIYLFFLNYVNPPKDFNLKKYLCYLLVILGLTCFTHLCIQSIHLNVIKDLEFITSELGWGNTNCAATLLLISIPACWYLITQVKNIIPLFIILVILHMGIILSGSDGVLAISLIFTPIIAFFTYLNIDAKRRAIYLKIILTILFVLTVSALVIVCVYDFEYLLSLLEPRFSDSSRTKLYQEALDLFSKYPIFGAGLGYQNPELPTLLGVRLYNFHSVLFHVMGTMGIIGIIAYTFYYTERFKLLMKNYNTFTLFITMAFIMFECYAFIDTSEFNAIPLMSTITVLFTIVELTNKKDNFQQLSLKFNSLNKINF